MRACSRECMTALSTHNHAGQCMPGNLFALQMCSMTMHLTFNSSTQVLTYLGSHQGTDRLWNPGDGMACWASVYRDVQNAARRYLLSGCRAESR